MQNIAHDGATYAFILSCLSEQQISVKEIIWNLKILFQEFCEDDVTQLILFVVTSVTRLRLLHKEERDIEIKPGNSIAI